MLIGESFDQRLAKEQFSSWKDHLPNYAKRHQELNPGDNVIAVLGHNDGTKDAWKEWRFTHNIVTVDGNKYYAQRGAGGTPTNPFQDSNGRLVLDHNNSSVANTDTYSAVGSPITGSTQTWDSTFPLTADADADNTGAGVTVVTWKVTYTAGSFNDTTIQGGAIHDAAGSAVGGSKLLTHFAISSFAKGSTDTLKMIVNHTALGV